MAYDSMTPARSCATVLEVLRACEEWFDGHPERVCFGDYARDERGKPCSVYSENVGFLSIGGAPKRFARDDDICGRAQDSVIYAAWRTVRNWSDLRNNRRANIVAAFRAAREREEGRG